jgi:hypothetical protein
MAFKLNDPPYYIDNTPIYNVDLGNEVLGKADRNGSILINKNITNEKQRQDVINHEKVHLDQMKRGDLDYNDSAVFWKGKKYSRAKMEEGAKNLPWEKEAYSKSK